MVFYRQYRIPHRKRWLDLRLLTDVKLPDLLGYLLRLLLDLLLELLHLLCKKGDDVGHDTLEFLTERDSRHHCLCIKDIHLVKEIHLHANTVLLAGLHCFAHFLPHTLHPGVTHEPTVLHLERSGAVELELRCTFPM